MATENLVKFNGTQALVMTASATQLVVRIPKNATSGQISIKVKNSVDAISTAPYTILPLITISGISPTSGPVGTIVTITGNNFSTTPSENIVFLSSFRCTVVSATSTQLKVIIPDGEAYGTIRVIVNNHWTDTPPFSVVAAPLSRWDEIYAPLGVGDMVIAAGVGTTTIFTNINLSNVNATSNLYALSYGLATGIYTDSQNTIGNVFRLNNSSSAFYLLGDQGIFRADNAAIWKVITPALGSSQFYTGLVTDGNQVIVYNGNNAYTSTDNGQTWGSQQPFNNPGVVTSNGYSTVYSGEAANNYYYSIPNVNARNVAITRSTDGINWVTTKGIQGAYAYSAGYRDILAASGDNVFCVYSSTITTDASLKRLYKSTDHGDTWTMVSNEKVNSVKAFGKYVIYGYDSLNISTDSGNTFTKYTIPVGYIITGIQKQGFDMYIFCSNGSIHKIFRGDFYL